MQRHEGDLSRYEYTGCKSWGLKQVMPLAKGITKYKGKIISLEISNVGLTDDQLKIICNALNSKNPNEMHEISLDFRGNNLTDESIQYLQNMGFKIYSLNLENNNFSDKALSFRNSIDSNSIGYINLENNYIQDTSPIENHRYMNKYISCSNQHIFGQAFAIETAGSSPEFNEDF